LNPSDKLDYLFGADATEPFLLAALRFFLSAGALSLVLFCNSERAFGFS
jgi:hypothetical protein